MNCKAKQQVDGGYICSRCDMQWDSDEMERPLCKTEKEIGNMALDKTRKQIGGLAIGSECIVKTEALRSIPLKPFLDEVCVIVGYDEHGTPRIALKSDENQTIVIGRKYLDPYNGGTKLPVAHREFAEKYSGLFKHPDDQHKYRNVGSVIADENGAIEVKAGGLVKGGLYEVYVEYLF